MTSVFKKIWDNPYYAPLTEPFRLAGAWGYGMIADYAEAWRRPRDVKGREIENPSREQRMAGLRHAFSYGGSFKTSFSTALMIFGTPMAGATAGVMTGMMLAASTSLVAAVAPTVVGIGVAVAAGFTLPYAAPALVSAISFGMGAAAGLTAGLVTGPHKAVRHHRERKNAAAAPSAPVAAQAATAAQTPPVPQASPDEAHEIGRRMANDFNKLDPHYQQEVIEGLRESAAPLSPQARAIRAMQEMDTAQQAELLEALEQALAPAFKQVNAKKRAQADRLAGDIAVRPITLKPRGTKAGFAAA